MKSVIFAIALLSGGAAFAQSGLGPPPIDSPMSAPPILPAESPDPMSPDTILSPGATAAPATFASTGSTALPGNVSPERDARGIAVISAAANVPAGYNGTPDTLTGMGGPLLDPATGEPAAMPDAAYPACTRTVTDHCLQTYERRRH